MGKRHSKCMAILLAVTMALSQLPVMAADTDAVISTTDGLAATVGNTLRVEEKNALGEVSYQWYADDEKIDGETTREFSPTYEQFEKSIKCVVRDENGEKESNAVSITSSFDAHKNDRWENFAQIPLGDEQLGIGNAYWDFSMYDDNGLLRSFTLLDTQNNTASKYYIITNDYYTGRTNNSNNNADINNTIYNPDLPGSVAYNANNGYIRKGASGNLPSAVIDAIDKNHVWITEGAYSGTLTEPYTFRAGVVTPAVWEMQEYADRIKIDIRKSHQINGKTPAWLRTALDDGFYHGINIDPDGDNNANEPLVYDSKSDKGYCFKLTPLNISTDTGYSRLQFFLNSEFFKNAKIQLDSAGDGIIENISKLSYSTLLGIYTEEEIETYLPEVRKTATALINTTDGLPATVGNTLCAEIANAVGKLTYQWCVDNVAIPDATQSEYVPTYEQLGGKISCIVTDESGVCESNKLGITSVFDEYAETSYNNMSIIYVDDNYDGVGDSSWEFKVDNKSFSLLDIQNNKESKFFVIANDIYGKSACGATDTLWNPNNPGTLAEYVNKETITPESANMLPEAIKNHIDMNHVWITEKAYSGNIAKPYTFTAGVTVPAIWEIKQYMNRITMDVRSEAQTTVKDSCWFRTAYKDDHYHGLNGQNSPVVKPSSTGKNYFQLTPLNVSASSACIRPQFYLDRGFFKTNSIDLTTAGSNILKMLNDEYTRSELLEIYSEAELEKAGLGENYNATVIWSSNNLPISTLTGVTALSAAVKVSTRLSSEKKCIAILTLYDESGMIVKMCAVDGEIATNTETVFPTLTLLGLTGVTDGYTAEIKIWDDAFNMCPLINAVKF